MADGNWKPLIEMEPGCSAYDRPSRGSFWLHGPGGRLPFVWINGGTFDRSMRLEVQYIDVDFLKGKLRRQPVPGCARTMRMEA